MDNTLYGNIFRCRTFQRGCRLGLVLLVLLLAACSEKNADAPLYNNVHPESWNNSQFVNAEPFHGTEVQNKGSLSCMKCHDIYGKGKEVLPGCYTCHFGPEGSKVPIGSDWTHGLTRHEEFESDQDVCNACHDQGRTYGTGPGICHDCHGSGKTHVLGQPWLDHKSPQFHGDEPQDECAICHNTDNDCNVCHFGASGSKAPVGSGWQHGYNEDHEEYENQAGTCNQCHTLNRSYGNGPVSCHDCHEIETHATGQTWLDSTLSDYHGNQPQQECAACHDLIVRCSQCHFGTTGSKAPIESGWQHGYNDGHKTFETLIDTCNQCHGLTRTYRDIPDAETCHDCHGSGVTHALGQVWLDSSLTGYHGNQSQQNCATCHDLSLDCNQCHFGSTGRKSPPGSKWPHGREDNHNDQKQYNQICNQCHALTQTYRNEPDDPECHVCHD